MENRNTNMRKVTNLHGKELMCFTLPFLNLEKRHCHCMRSTLQTGKERLSWLQPMVSRKKRGGREQETLAKKISTPLAWSFAFCLLLLLSFLLLVLLCQCWLLPATHFTFHQGQGTSKKVSQPTAYWPEWPWSAAASQWASWCTWCDTQRSERLLHTPGKRAEWKQ